MESLAITTFEQQSGKTVKPTGIWLHATGILGASPDGLLPEENAVIEVKCPFGCRDKTFEESKRILPFLCVDEMMFQSMLGMITFIKYKGRCILQVLLSVTS